MKFRPFEKYHPVAYFSRYRQHCDLTNSSSFLSLITLVHLASQNPDIGIGMIAKLVQEEEPILCTLDNLSTVPTARDRCNDCGKRAGRAGFAECKRSRRCRCRHLSFGWGLLCRNTNPNRFRTRSGWTNNNYHRNTNAHCHGRLCRHSPFLSSESPWSIRGRSRRVGLSLQW